MTKSSDKGPKIIDLKPKQKFNFWYLVAGGISLVIAAVLYYFMLPSMNPQKLSTWVFFVVVLLIYGFLSIILAERKNNHLSKFDLVVCGIILLTVLIVLVAGLSSTTLFRASDYASLIEVEECEVDDVISQDENISDIALMDTDSAKIIGAKAIGALSDVVSQYVISTEYSTIDLNGKPMKVAPLEYDGFFKYMGNKDSGIPGYVMVDPVNNESSYVELIDPIRYSPSAYFSYDLRRHLTFNYPTKIFEEFYFEIDNEGKPYWICPAYSSQVGLFGGKDVTEVIICDACTGDMSLYKLGEVPQWVDRVYDGDLCIQKYDWYGTLSGGFWNSKIGNVGCKITTDDYGYKVMDGDVWIYTGITSVTGDESNIGFVLINSRTGEAKSFAISGADEKAAMSAAEGEVQHLGYEASFPSLINIDGQPTYIMVLKDNGGLVKMYALVNVENYGIVATAGSQKEVMSLYRKLLKENDLGEQGDATEDITKTIVVSDIKFLTMEGTTVVYITSGETAYRQLLSENEELVLIGVGDTVEVTYSENGTSIKDMVSASITQKAQPQQ